MIGLFFFSNLLGTTDQIEFSDQSQYVKLNTTNIPSASAESISPNQTINLSPGLLTFQVTTTLPLANTLRHLAIVNAHTLKPLEIQSLEFLNSTMGPNGAIIDTTAIYGVSNDQLVQF